MGLRDTKKERARGAILKAARELFLSLGYHGATLEAIAEAAGVAAGTVYNYFESKSALIQAVTVEDASASLTVDPVILEDASGLTVLMDCIHAFIERLSFYPRDLLRELAWDAFSGSGSAGGDPTVRCITLADGLEGLLWRLAGTGVLRKDIDTRMASLVICGAVMTGLMWYAADAGRTLREMLDSMDAMLETVCRGLEPKGAEE